MSAQKHLLPQREAQTMASGHVSYSTLSLEDVSYTHQTRKATVSFDVHCYVIYVPLYLSDVPFLNMVTMFLCYTTITAFFP